ncbi:MAG: hypothetical protein HY532_00580 [Chloroflexi bacterium]|nr:hypothetical protein [Chloroflexota bacterium]
MNPKRALSRCALCGQLIGWQRGRALNLDETLHLPSCPGTPPQPALSKLKRALESLERERKILSLGQTVSYVSPRRRHG